MWRSGVRPSVCLSISPVDRQHQRRAPGLLLSLGACRRYRSTPATSAAFWRSTDSCSADARPVAAGSIMLTAEVGGSSQTCLMSGYWLLADMKRYSSGFAINTVAYADIMKLYLSYFYHRCIVFSSIRSTYQQQRSVNACNAPFTPPDPTLQNSFV